jgi:putative copper export protein
MIRLKLLLIAIIALLSVSVYASQLPMATFAQEFHNSNSTEAVTSTNDAVLKSILIVSQVSVIGITFSYLFFHRISGKKTRKHKDSKEEEEENNVFIYGNGQYLKRFTVMVSSCCISITLASTGIILVSAYELSRETAMDLFSTFSILYPTSVGQVWAIRIATSLLTMGLVITHYALKKRATKKKTKGDDQVKNHSSQTTSPIILILLVVIIIVSSINLYSNSMISHSNALPFFNSLAISMDWIHFMAVSIWIGGLFYLSTILLKGLKSSLYNHHPGNANANNNNDKKYEMKNSVKNTQHTLILLTYFSLIAIVSLTIIGITGMYLGLVHLQSINAVFSTAYGNILIIKLSLAFPLILLGRYNQLKIQKYAKSSKNILKANFNNDNPNTPFIVHNENKLDFFNAVNRSIKIESVIGISVLVAASFLSVTSPPSLSASTLDFISNGNNNNNNAGATSTNMIASDFSSLAVILSVVILVLGIINFRKNQQNIKDMSITD